LKVLNSARILTIGTIKSPKRKGMIIPTGSERRRDSPERKKNRVEPNSAEHTRMKSYLTKTDRQTNNDGTDPATFINVRKEGLPNYQREAVSGLQQDTS
jgi:hypothetical protein